MASTTISMTSGLDIDMHVGSKSMKSILQRLINKHAQTIDDNRTRKKLERIL